MSVPSYYYRHRWIFLSYGFYCDKCGAVDRTSTSPPEMGCPYSEANR